MNNFRIFSTFDPKIKILISFVKSISAFLESNCVSYISTPNEEIFETVPRGKIITRGTAFSRARRMVLLRDSEIDLGGEITIRGKREKKEIEIHEIFIYFTLSDNS